MNRNQEKNLKTGRESCDEPAWVCSNCGHTTPGFFYRCENCQSLRPDERQQRLEMRAKDGEIGKGGGYFQRSSPDDHKEWNSDDEEYDEFGRKKRKSSTTSSRSTPKAVTGREAMTDRQ